MFGGFGPYSQDILAGGSGVDTFILAATNFSIEKSKCDVISDFNTSNDKIGLELGLTYASLTLEQSGSDCYIKDASGNYLLNLIFHRLTNGQ